MSKVVLVVDLFVLALEAHAELTALLPFLEALAIFLLAVRLLAGAEDEVLHAGLVGIDLLEVMHVLAVLLLDQVQNLVLLILPLRSSVLSLERMSDTRRSSLSNRVSLIKYALRN